MGALRRCNLGVRLNSRPAHFGDDAGAANAAARRDRHLNTRRFVPRDGGFVLEDRHCTVGSMFADTFLPDCIA